MTSREVEESRIEGDRVYDGTVVRLDVDRVRRPDGRESVREVIRHQGASVMLPVLDDGRVVFVRQFRYAAGRVLLELPAGKIDPGEAPEQTARRELEEETGLRAEVMQDLGSFFTTPGFTDERLHAFLARGLVRVGGAGGEDDESIEVVALAPPQIARAVAAGELEDAKSLATFLLAAAAGLVSLPFASGEAPRSGAAPDSGRHGGG